ncbi:MAG: C-GCAxxG-C-C family protein [Candidatus Gastranaerophilales bacterium]|nr:C-GCAxxG-C-C family protein [Candidatus Gastranaerophilales bacterium]
MVKKSELAKLYFNQGYNCAQSVLLPFAEEIGLTKDEALKLASSFGGGMGKLREVCGAVSSLFMIAGLKKGYTSPADDEVKTQHYKLIQDLANQFKANHNTIICRELLNKGSDGFIPSVRNAEYYKTRPCERFVETAAELADELLNEERAL